MTEETKKEEKTKSNVLVTGLDIGTMNVCLARSDSKEIKITRNVFLPLSKDEVSISELTDISYVEDNEGNLFIIGQDAFTFGNIFGQQVSRPMESGLISPKEVSAIDVLTLILKDLFGDVKDKEVYCSYSIPAEAIDEGRSVTYHEKVFSRVLSNLGINHTPVNEGAAIIYSECSEEKFSGVGISLGAGMSNIAVLFKGIEALKFSTARSGDWIDKNVAASLSMVPNRVTSVKEKNLNLEKGFLGEKNKKKKRILEALQYYYEALINYTVKKIIKEFDEKVDIEIEESIPIIISGGTSIPNGFLDLFKNILITHELPFKVSGIRQARNPLTCVASGLLVKTMADVHGK